MRFPVGAWLVDPVGKPPPAQLTGILEVRTLWLSQVFLGGEIYNVSMDFLVVESAMEFKISLSLEINRWNEMGKVRGLRRFHRQHRWWRRTRGLNATSSQVNVVLAPPFPAPFEIGEFLNPGGWSPEKLPTSHLSDLAPGIGYLIWNEHCAVPTSLIDNLSSWINTFDCHGFKEGYYH